MTPRPLWSRWGLARASVVCHRADPRGAVTETGRDCPEFWGGLSLRVTAGPEPLQAGSREPGAGVRHHLRATHGDRRCGTGVSGSGPRTLPCQQGCPATRKWPWSTPQPWWSWGNRVHGTGAPTARPGVPAPGRHAHPCGEHEAAVRWRNRGRRVGPPRSGASMAEELGFLHGRKLKWPCVSDGTGWQEPGVPQDGCGAGRGQG